jgi:2'-hydroxyisoflavone reductase
VKLLILGGTRFLGRHLVDAALVRGHDVTLFNRGQTNPGLFPGLETLIGNRDGNLASLKNRSWDAVIDTCGYFPRLVRSSAELLKDSVEHYTFISSISVYDENAVQIDEKTLVGTIEDSTIEEITGETYGPLKALCERAVQEIFPEGALIIRPGLIVGPHDPSDRFTYWPVRMARGGEVLAPGDPQMPVQIIDARDLAEWNIELVEDRLTGVFNATGPKTTLSMIELLESCQEVSGLPSTLTWVSEEFLLGQKVVPFIELPLWLPKSEWAMSRAGISKALIAGLKFRSLRDTIADTLDWDQTRPVERVWVNGLKPEREAELLAAWNLAVRH